MFEDMDRDIAAIRLPRWDRAVAVKGPVPWLVVDDDGAPFEPIRRDLTDSVTGDTSKGSVRSYGYVLLRWWRLLCTTQGDTPMRKPDTSREQDAYPAGLVSGGVP